MNSPIKNKSIRYIAATLLVVVTVSSIASPVSAVRPSEGGSPTSTSTNGNKKSFSAPSADTCGSGDSKVKTSINIGCTGKGNSILDVTFAIIRFMSNGVGLVLIGSLVWGGIQYSLSAGDPQKSAAAQNRIKSVLFALVLFIFAYAILNYLVPGKLLQ